MVIGSNIFKFKLYNVLLCKYTVIKSSFYAHIEREPEKYEIAAVRMNCDPEKNCRLDRS